MTTNRQVTLAEKTNEQTRVRPRAESTSDGLLQLLALVMEKASVHHLALIGRRQRLVSSEWLQNDVSGVKYAPASRTRFTRLSSVIITDLFHSVPRRLRSQTIRVNLD